MGDTTLDELKQLITSLAADVSTIKADQARLHVAVNKVQSDVVGDGSSTSGPKGKGVTADGSGRLSTDGLPQITFPQVRRRHSPPRVASPL
jgi:hypothetical protein